LDNGAYCHMKEDWELLRSLTERDSDVHVQHGDDFKYAMKGGGTIMFQLESGGSLDAQDVLYIPRLKDNFLLVSAMEDRGFVVIFQSRKVLIHKKKSILDIEMVIRVSDGTLYRLKSKPV
jgi:hypothetical protein